ncbi:MAG: UTP--glucose-1-phosphate uridylyltransferase GalU [Pseudomonadota bacterium]
MTKRVRKAIFPVGGLGTRFLPATKAMPKEMLPVVDKPLIQYALEEARAAGIEEFIFVTGRGKTAIEDHFDNSVELQTVLEQKGKADMLDLVLDTVLKPGQISYVRQQEPMGLGHAVWCARNLVHDEPFAILLADDLIRSDTPCLKQMIDLHMEIGGNVIAAMRVPEAHTGRYGIVDPGAVDGKNTAVNGLVEKPDPSVAPSNLAVIGRYILDSTIFDHLNELKRGAGGEVQLTDAMAQLIGEAPFTALQFEGQRYDCGDKVGFLQATVDFALNRPALAEPLKAFLRTLPL